MRKVGRLRRGFAAGLKRIAGAGERNDPIVQSRESRSALNASVAGRRWNGQLFQPTPHANAAAWGFGFVPPPGGVQSLAVPLGRHCFGQKLRVKIWRAGGLKPTDPFRPPGAKGDRLIFDSVIQAVASVQGEAIAQFCRVALTQAGRLAPCMHLVELGFADPPKSPLAVGRSTSEGPWTWECGWVHLKGRHPIPLERPWGVAWSAYGDEVDMHSLTRAGQGEVDVMGRVEVRAFQVSLPSVAVVRTSQTVISPPVEFQVPEPAFREVSAVVPAGAARIALPFRHAQLLGFAKTALRQMQTEFQRTDDDRDELRFDYRGWASRYDLVSIDRDSGQPALTLGQDRALDPEEFPAVLPPRHIALYSLYTTRDGVEAIPVWQWRDMVRNDRRSEYLWWLESSRKCLARTFRKLRSGAPIRLAGYGDSLTSLGGRDPSMILAPNGPFRDRLGYFERNGEDWKYRVELFGAPGEEACHHRLGWNWHLKAAIESCYPVEVEYLNWGIPGTTTESSFRRIDGHAFPNGSEQARRERLLASRPDLVTVSFGMNDIGEQIDTYANMRRICDSITAAGADVIVVGLCQQNAGFDSRDHALWRLTHDHIAAAAHDSQVAYIPTWEFFGDGNEGATGLSRWSHSAASMTNHPGARELAHIGAYMAKIIS